MKYSTTMAPSTGISDFISLVKQSYEVLHRETDLTPANPVIMETISNLTQQIRRPYTQEEIQQVLGDKDITMLRGGLLAKLSEAECRMEMYDSQCLSGHTDLGLEGLYQYENWEKYAALVGRELEVLDRFVRPEDVGRPIVFVGSGPIPLSAVLMHLQKKVTVFCVDNNPEACEASRVLIDRIGLGDQVHIIEGDGAEFDYSQFHQVFVASLVSCKDRVLEQIRRTSADSLVAVRTAEGIRQLMYEAVDEEAMAAAGWNLLGRTWPKERIVINSTLFYRLADH